MGNENEYKKELLEKIERFKLKAEDFLKNNIKAFIVDINDTWYSCNIILVGDVSVLVNNFDGDNLGNKKIYWADIVRLEEYRKEVEE